MKRLAIAALTLAALPGCLDGGFRQSKPAPPPPPPAATLEAHVEGDSVRIQLDAAGIPTSGDESVVGMYFQGVTCNAASQDFGWAQTAPVWLVRSRPQPDSITGRVRLEMTPGRAVARVALRDLGAPLDDFFVQVGWTDSLDNRLGELRVHCALPHALAAR